jgi:MFS transporter, FHS family, L-fucose permease
MNTRKSTNEGMFVTEDGQNVRVTFLLVILLFALWGFCTGMLDVMDKHFQVVLDLDLAQSASVQFAHYLGYFLMALPAGWLATKLGYKGGIICGLLLVTAGGVWFIPATHIGSFWAFLLGVSIVAVGLAFLQTVANPYSIALGPEKYAATRINLAQAFNGIGLIFGPIVASLFFRTKNAEDTVPGNETLWVPYAAVGILGIILVVAFYFANVPDIKLKDDFRIDDSTSGEARSIWSQPHFLIAVFAQFLYVGAEVSIYSSFINYMTSQVPEIPPSLDAAVQHSHHFLKHWMNSLTEIRTTGDVAFSNQGASNLVSVAFLVVLVGRFIGSGLLRKFAADKLLRLYGAINTMLCLLVFLKLGWLSAACLLGTYFFMSIMFPTIFALGIFGLGQRGKKASSFLVMAIVGGAIVPKVMGAVADIHDLSRGFIVPMVCFAFIAVYAFLWPRLSGSGGRRTESNPAH